MYIDPHLPLLALGPKKYRAWPKALAPGRITYHPLSWLLTASHEGDAHVAAYSVPSVLHRLGTDPPAYARVAGGIPMTVFLLDIDCASAHRATGGSGAVRADDAWWSLLRRRIEALDAVHPGAFAYRTRGGARLIYRPRVPLVIENGTGEIAWKRLYLACLVYLARRFSIVADPSISDWPRLIRLPHVTRDGVFQRAETLGDPFSVGVLDFGDDGEDEGAMEFARRLAANTKVWAPALRILARNALPPERRARNTRPIKHHAVHDIGTWNALASDLGRALTRHTVRHGVHLALAGACYDRGVPLERGPELARAICAASGETDDRPQVWQTTADRVRAGQTVTGYGHLATHWPDLAALIDTALPSGGGARAVRDELDERGTPDAIVASEASSTIRTALTNPPPGLSLLRVTEGAGKTRAAVDVLRARALDVGDCESIPSAMKSLYVAPTHRVAAEVADALRGTRGVYLRSVLAAGGCAYHVPLGRVTAARHAVQTWCEGWGMGYKGAPKPCDKLKGCPARAGAVVQLGGDGSPAVVVTVHSLLQQGLNEVGDNALVIIDEDPDAVEALTLTREELETAAGSESDFALSERFRGPVLRALAVGLERGDLPTENPLRVVFERGCAALADDTAWTTQVTQEYGTTDPTEILRAYAWKVVWSEYKDAKGTTLRRRSAWAPRPSKRSHAAVIAGAVSERFTGASLTHATVARLVAGVVQEKATNGAEHSERAVAAVEVAPGDGSRRVLRAVIASPAVAAALHRYGPTVLLDATADTSIVNALAQGNVPATDVRVEDGATVERRLLFWSGASRKHVLAESGDVRWVDGLERYLRAALAMVYERGARSIGLFTWKPLADVLRAGTDPIARAILDELGAAGVGMHVGHYGDARSRNDWMNCEALVSLGDPKPNVGASRAIAAVLGLSEKHDEVYRRATAAELSQVAGRLRAPWRKAPALHIHVGTIAPASWDGRAKVMELTKGLTTEMDATVVAQAVHVYGSKRLAAAAIGVSRRTVGRTLASAGNACSEDCYEPRQETPSVNTKTVVPVAVGNTLKTQRFSVPTPPLADGVLIDSLGGAPAVATLLGVNRATVYHWIAGRRPMPDDARQRLMAALATPVAPEPPPVTFAPPVAAARAPAAREWFTAPEVPDATA